MNNTTTINIIAISYFFHKNNNMKMEIFDNEIDAKNWLFMELKKDNVLTNWYDDENNAEYYGFDMIYENIKHQPLTEIIRGVVLGGDIEIIIKYYSKTLN
jgi:hypothetical protein